MNFESFFENVFFKISFYMTLMHFEINEIGKEPVSVRRHNRINIMWFRFQQCFGTLNKLIV